MRKYIIFGLSLALTAGMFYLLFNKIPFSATFNIIKNADLKIVLLALCISVFGNCLIPTNRWRVILKSLGYQLSFKEALLIKMGTKPLISLFPMKTGELSRVVYLKRVLRIPYFQATGSIIIEYMLNFLVVICSILFGIIIYMYQGGNYNASAQINVTFCSYVFLKQNFLKNLLNKFSSSQRMLLKNCFRKSRVILNNKSLFFYTALMVFAGTLNIYLLSRALHNPIPLYGILIFLPVVQLITIFRVTIGGLGVREAAIVFFFSNFGSFETLLSLGILYSIVDHMFPVLIGTSVSGVFLKRILKSKIP